MNSQSWAESFTARSYLHVLTIYSSVLPLCSRATNSPKYLKWRTFPKNSVKPRKTNSVG